MTTIAWDGKTIAADSLVTESGQVMTPSTRKLYPLFDGMGQKYVLGWTGPLHLMRLTIPRILTSETKGWPAFSSRFLEFMRDIQKGEVDYGFTILRCSPMRMDLMDYWMHYPELRVRTGDLHAIGTGSAYAIGAMMAGATAAEAVKIASERSASTGGKIVEIRPRDVMEMHDYEIIALLVEEGIEIPEAVMDMLEKEDAE